MRPFCALLFYFQCCINSVALVSISRVAGTVDSFANGPASSAAFSYPSGVAVVPEGPLRSALVVADSGNNRLRLIYKDEVTTLCGSSAGFSDGSSDVALFSSPWDVAVLPPLSALENHTIVVSDRLNSALRLVALNGSVTTLAGNATTGYADGVGSQALFFLQRGISVSPDGLLIFVADYGNSAIRVVTREGRVTTLAGSRGRGNVDGVSTSAQFDLPFGVLAASASGIAVYVTDPNNGSLRRVSVAGAVVTVTRSVSSEYASESFSDGRIIIANTYKDNILMLDTATDALTTLVGSGMNGDVDGEGTNAAIYNPIGLSLAYNSTIFLADYGNHKIKKITGLAPLPSALPSAAPPARAPPPPEPLSAGIIVLLTGVAAAFVVGIYYVTSLLRLKSNAIDALLSRFAGDVSKAPYERALSVVQNPIAAFPTSSAEWDPATDPVHVDGERKIRPPPQGVTAEESLQSRLGEAEAGMEKIVLGYV